MQSNHLSVLGPEVGEKVKEDMNKLKQWVMGITLLVATPFLMMFAMLAMVFFKLPILIFMLYNEFWEDYKDKRKKRNL